MKHTFAIVITLIALLLPPLAIAAGKVESLEFESAVLADNIIGISPHRRIMVYTPANYTPSARYPVIYYLHNLGWSGDRVFSVNKFNEVLDQAIERGDIPPVIAVVPDLTTNTMGTMLGNARESGRWLDHIKNELVPLIDARYPTVKSAKGRALSGDMLGAYGALKLAMFYPDTFASAYALHPVANGIGEVLMRSRPDWAQMNAATSWDDLKSNVYSEVFMLMAQGYLPNPNKPPFYADLMVEDIDGHLQVNVERTRRLRRGFLLNEMLPDYAANLKQLCALGFDWGRMDPNPDHVYGNQDFTRLLADYGIEHMAEEHGGGPWDRNWGLQGRMAERALPFLGKCLKT